MNIESKEYKNKISAIIFNLGYLPNGNKDIKTNYKSTVKSIKEGLNLLNNKGVILIVIYSHKEGKKESLEIDKLIENIKDKYIALKYYNTDNINTPYLIEIRQKND